MEHKMNEAFKAIANGTRRRILAMLRDEDMTAGQIAAQFDMSWPSISHHLKVLRQAKLVLAERDGQERIYSLNTTVVQEFLADFLALFGEGEDAD
jgi:DNA-binding transcriptional ArsR family regulator